MSTYQVRSLEEADLIVKQHEKKTKTSYALLRSTKNFGCVEIPACSNEEQEVRFETVGVPYCGVPFFVAGLKILQCQSYKEKGARANSRKKEIKIELPGSCASVINSPMEQASPQDALNRSLAMPARKKKKLAGGRALRASCTATVILKEVIYYPEFQLLEHSRNNRLGVARQLKEVLRNRSPIQKDRIIYVTVPSHSDHFGHPVGQISNKKIYLKNDYYGPIENGTPTQSSHNSATSPSKRLYYPVKEEKVGVISNDLILGLPQSCYDEPVKVNTVATQAAANCTEKMLSSKAKEVRDMLQSIMAFTYKCADLDIFERLHLDLLAVKQRYLERSKLGKKRLGSQEHLVLSDASKPGQQQLQQQTVAVQPHPQIVLLKQAKSNQQQPIIQQQLVPRLVTGPRPIRLKGQQPQQSILQVQQMDTDSTTLSITINPVAAVGTSSSIVPLSGAALSGIQSATSSAAGLSSDTLGSPAFASIAGSTLHAMPIASLPTVSIAASVTSNVAPTPITTLPSFPTVVVPSAALQPSNVTLAIPAGSFSTLPGTLPAFSDGSTFPTRSIASAASISLGSISTLQTGVLPPLQCSASSLPSLVGPVFGDILMAPAVTISASSNSTSYSALSSASHPVPAQRMLTSVSTNRSYMSNTSLKNASVYSVNVSRNSVTSAGTMLVSPSPSLAAGTIIPSCSVAYITGPASKSTCSSPHFASIASSDMSLCTSGDGSSFSSNAGGVTSTWTVAAPVLRDVNSACNVSSTCNSSIKLHSDAASKKSSFAPVTSETMDRDGYVHEQHMQASLASEEHRDEIMHTSAALSSPSSSTPATTGTCERISASDIKNLPDKSSGTSASTPSDASNNQETSIFIEAMEAILNSHM